MSAPQIDYELLAAFLDGSATPDERETVLRLAAGSREAYAELREAAAIRGELHGDVALADAPERAVDPVLETAAQSDGPPAVTSTMVPGGARKNRFRFAVPVVMLAAAGLAIVVVQRMRTARSETDVIAIAQALRVDGATGSGSLSRTLGVEWDRPGWTVMRGREPTLSASARAFQAGVRFSQLELGVGASDSVAVTGAAREIVALLRDVAGSAPATAALDAMMQRHAVANAAEHKRIGSEVRDLTGESAWFNLGCWIGAVQVAARSGRVTSLQRSGTLMRALEPLLNAAEPTAPESSRPALAALRALRLRVVPDSSVLADVQTTLRSAASVIGS
jgi:hypothetical protein